MATAMHSKHVRLFFKAASARLAEGRFLFKHKFTMGAVCLGGYAVECALKAILLSTYPERERYSAMSRFRGVKAHDYNWLISEYRRRGGPVLPVPVARAFSTLSPWGTDLRYNPRTTYPGNAEEFFAATGCVIEWARKRV